jgi:Ca2+:H+ antiporter
MPTSINHLLSNVRLRNILIPLFSCAVLALIWGRSPGWILLLLAAIALIAAVLVAVHHADVIARRIGEPFGALVLALAVTVIEASLIVSMMLSDTIDASALARDTVFAAVMIVCNGVIGLCLLVGALKHRVLGFRTEGTTPALAVLATLATTILVLPDFTFSTQGPTFSDSQLIFASVASLSLYGVFIFVQTIRHRDYFLPETDHTEDTEVEAPTAVSAWTSLALLIISLVAVVGLAESLAPTIESFVARAGMPHAVVGIAIAMMVLLPETATAVRSAQRDRMQISFNLALGSALASICLTVPAVAFLSIALNLPMDLGLPPKEIALLALTLLLTSMTLSGGHATILQGSVHLVVFAVFIFTAMVP